ncbi:DUF1614 domain-containing protein [Vulcanisaeta thermophila]|uniref:DUF1614 domain-containing protein n=1 Tax=Vulcanisaeta thermophila TaxID=867917 RepID=UPI000852D808|nr:DUF1614 domain-containing protein [Vulcanisaeta thermophila]
MSVNYRIRPSIGLRFSIPLSTFLFIALLLMAPFILFILMVLINIGLNPIIAFTITVISIITSPLNIVIAEVTYYPLFTGPFKLPLLPFYRILFGDDRLFIELNVGGGLIPIIISIYLIINYLIQNYQVLTVFLISLALASIIINSRSRIVQGVGVGVPSALPILITLVFTLIATVILRANPLAFSYSLGALSTLIGADLMNLRKVIHLMRGHVSIGGAGVFDGIYLTSLLSLILASIYKVLLLP